MNVGIRGSWGQWNLGFPSRPLPPCLPLNPVAADPSPGTRHVLSTSGSPPGKGFPSFSPHSPVCVVHGCNPRAPRGLGPAGHTRCTSVLSCTSVELLIPACPPVFRGWPNGASLQEASPAALSITVWKKNRLACRGFPDQSCGVLDQDGPHVSISGGRRWHWLVQGTWKMTGGAYVGTGQ